MIVFDYAFHMQRQIIFIQLNENGKLKQVGNIMRTNNNIINFI